MRLLPAGQIMAAAALLEKKRNPSDRDIDAIENICRCGTYFRIRSAIKQAATQRRGSRAAAAPAAAAARDGGAAKVTREAEGVLAAADVGGTRVLPATGAGAGAAGLIAAAAAAIRGRRETDDELEQAEPVAEG